MKKRFLTLMMIATLCTCAACGSSSSQADDSSYVIEDGTYYTGTGYEIELTDRWTPTELDNTDLAFLNKDSTNTDFTESLNVMVTEYQDKDINLELLKKNSLEDFKKLGYIIDETKKVTIGGNDSIALICHKENDGALIYFKQIFTVVDKSSYVFTFGAQKDDFDKLENEITASFNTIKYGNYSKETSETD